jgi:hypothetical protein
MGQDGVIDAAHLFTARNRPLAEILASAVDQVTRDELDRAFAFLREESAKGGSGAAPAVAARLTLAVGREHHADP